MEREPKTGGGLGSNRRPRAGTDQEPIQDGETQVGPVNSQQEGEVQGLPRLLDQSSAGSLPNPSGMVSRTPSSASGIEAQPMAGERDSAGAASRSSHIHPPAIEPPVTRSTLSELDVQKIIHNPKLRHDINFDPDLHFRPNLEGEKGKKKQEKAQHFWDALRDQLIQFVCDRQGFYASQKQPGDWCLPMLLKAVKDIIHTLVPTRDRVYIDEGLNVDLLMQQFDKGIADLEKLALWLSGVLKSHCAPMRDEWVDEMYNQLSNGNRTNNVDELVQGMRSLLSVLEAMKLDVANHQIRCLRPVLIEDTVHFEQRFFYKKISAGRLDVTAAKLWYQEAERRYSDFVSQGAGQSFGDMAVFFEAVSRLILPSVPAKTVPNTFLFDEERFVKVRADMLDAINLEICMRMYDDLERVGHSQPVPFFGSYASCQLDEEVGMPSLSMTPDFNFNTPPSRPSSLVFSSAGSANSSPRSSLVLPSCSASDASDTKSRARNLYNSLVALMQSAPPAPRQSARWQAMAPSLALQIFRYTNAPADLLPMFEAKLASHVCDTKSALFHEVEEHFHGKLLQELQRRVRDLRGLSAVGLFSLATGGRIHGPGRTWDGGRDSERERDMVDSSPREAREEGGIEDMATRLAHLGILHWRVWSQIAYNRDDIDSDTSLDIQLT